MPIYYGIDTLYLVLVLPAILLAIFAQVKVQSTFKKYSAISSSRYITGSEAARKILDSNGLSHVRVEQVSGNLTDHFDPKANVIRLSDSVYSSHSVAAIGIAAHEAGHAVQYAKNYTPIRLRAAIIPMTRIGSFLTFPLILLGFLLNSPALAYLGVAAFGLSTLFQLVTLPVEFNASRRAISAIQDTFLLREEELQGAKKVLSAAAMTYLAALAVSLMQLLRLLLLTQNRKR